MATPAANQSVHVFPSGMTSSFGPCNLGDNDDKYAKSMGKTGAHLSKCCDVLGGLSLRDVKDKEVKSILQSPFQLYICFLMAGSMLYYLLGGRLGQTSTEDLLGYTSVIAEALGLLSLRLKIAQQGSVSGISGMTVAMYAIVYLLREMLLLPPMEWESLDGWAVEVLQLPSIYMVLDILRSVFVGYRKTYQEDLDVLKVHYLVPGCMALALLLRPGFPQGLMYSYCWTSYLYMDVVALVPQIVMMARGGGKVEAPIAHFVAATALRWFVDLSFWYYSFDLGPQGYIGNFNYSGWIIVVVHVLSLVFVADFMYYYVKARLSGSSLSEDLTIEIEV